MRFVITIAVTVLLGSAGGHANALTGSRIDTNEFDSPWAGVGAITLENGNTFTGTLIGPRHVLTAAHVVSGQRFKPGNIVFHLNLGGDLTNSFVASSVRIYPDYRGTRAGSDGIWHHDLAVIELSEPVPSGVPVYDLYRSIPGISPGGREMTFVSYGAGVDPGQDVISPGKPNTKRVGENRLKWLLPDDDGSQRPDIYIFEVGTALRGGNASGHPDSSFQTLGGGMDAGYIGGDSGSPVFMREDGVWKLAGIAAFSGRLGGKVEQAFGGGTLVKPYADWISAQINAPAERQTELDRPDKTRTFIPIVACLVLVGYAMGRRRYQSVRGKRTAESQH